MGKDFRQWALTGLDVSPYHWRHVTLIIHEASIEIWCFIWVWRNNVSLATGEWILEEMKHGEEFSGGHQHVVTKPTKKYVNSIPHTVEVRILPGNDGVVHDWLFDKLVWGLL
jgi:hypothetical protein